MAGRMLDVSVVAARLGVSRQHVRRLIEEARLFGVEVGLGKKQRRYKVPEDALEDFIRKQGNGALARMQTR